MKGGGGEFQDWEMLQNSEIGFVQSLDVVEKSGDFGGIVGDSEGAIRLDYFSLDSGKRYVRTVAEGDVSEEGSVDSDNPSWVDPGSEPRVVLDRKNSSEFWSDSSNDRSVSCKYCDVEGINELCCAYETKNEVGIGGIEEGEGMNQNPSKSWLDSGGGGLVSMKFENVEEGGSDLGVYDKSRDKLKLSAESEGANGSESSDVCEFEAGNSLDFSGIFKTLKLVR